MFYKFSDKKSKGSGVTALANKSAIKSTPQNKLFSKEPHKSIIRKFRKRKVYAAFKDNIWGANMICRYE